jgi:hypothetical protein
MTATASSITPTRIAGAAAFFIAHLASGVTYHADGSKEKRNLRAEGEPIHRGRKV